MPLEYVAKLMWLVSKQGRESLFGHWPWSLCGVTWCNSVTLLTDDALFGARGPNRPPHASCSRSAPLPGAIWVQSSMTRRNIAAAIVVLKNRSSDGTDSLNTPSAQSSCCGKWFASGVGRI